MPGSEITIEQNVTKKKKVFIKDGKTYEGGIEEYYQMGHDMGRTPGADRFPKPAKDKK